jgi:hypothetical protein
VLLVLLLLLVMMMAMVLVLLVLLLLLLLLLLPRAAVGDRAATAEICRRATIRTAQTW